MPKMIKDGRIVEDLWDYGDLPMGCLPDRALDLTTGKPVIRSVAQWLSYRSSVKESESGGVASGVWIEGHCDPDIIANDLNGFDGFDGFDVVAVYFPAFTDGRGFSLGNLLRQRWSFQGELRAIGHLIPDQYNFLNRCGFNAFVPEKEDDLGVALSSLREFTFNYQEEWDNERTIIG